MTALGGAIAATACGDQQQPRAPARGNVVAQPRPAQAAPSADTGQDDWEGVRGQFALSPDYAHLSALYIASHPKPVREAIDEYRRNLDAEPVIYLDRENRRRQREARQAAARYLGVDADDIALTDSTTMGVGLIYSGLRLKPQQEILTTEHDYYVTQEAVRVAAARTGARVREIPLYDDIQKVTIDEIVERIRRDLTPATRVLALTWVSSNTGLKLPLKQIAGVVEEANRKRDEDERVLLGVDGVHGFGVEDVTMADLGGDFFMAGCHKWLFGPRGTGIVWAKRDAWAAVRPSIPSFTDDEVWQAWLNKGEPEGPATASRITPGGFKPFEHQWALTQAFAFHQDIGKARVAARTHELARRAKEGLASMSHVALQTPLREELSAGIVTFDVARMAPRAVVERLRAQHIVATTTPYATVHVRIAPCIRNTAEEIDRFLTAVRDMA